MAERTAVHCETEEEWNAVRIKADKPYVSDWQYAKHYKDICIYLKDGGGFDRKEDCLRGGYKVVTAKNYLGGPKRKKRQDRAVHCTTKKEWDAVIEEAKKTGIPPWDRLNNYSQKCIYVDSAEGFDEKPDCIKRGSTVISAREYLRVKKKRGSLGINFGSMVRNMPIKETVDEPELESMWKPIETAPKDKFILIKLNSGYMSYPVDAMVAQYSTAYGRWRTVQNDSVTDSHECPPLGWMEVPE